MTAAGARAAWLTALVLAVGLFMTLAAAPAARADDPPRRVALVVANGNYLHAGSLKNPVNDGALIATALKSAGFVVIDASPNLGIGPFRDALRRFRSNAAGAQVALVYYAGHGIEARGKNWLIPTDAVLLQDADLDYEAIDLDLVLSATEGADMRVVVLDACRNNPFGHTWKRTQRAVGEGLAPVDVDDVLVIYSAGPGQTASDGHGANSPFATALAKRLPQPGVPIQLLGGLVRDDVLRATGSQQRPFISASITGTPFMLVPGAAPAGPAAEVATAAAPRDDAHSVEMMFWQSASSGEDVGMLRAYVARYPNGSFVELARARITSLEHPSPGAGGERNLTAAAKPDPRSMELAYWNSVSASNDAAQLQAYVDQYPGGQFVRIARAKIAALGHPAVAANTAPANAQTSMSPGRNTVGGYQPMNAAPAAQPLPQVRTGYGASDDYVCNHGDPADPRTVTACRHLRGEGP